MTTRVIESPYAPEFFTASDSERERLRIELQRAAKTALLELSPAHRPSEQACENIADFFAEFVVVCRIGTPEDHIAMMRARGRDSDAIIAAAQPDDASWKSMTGWARGGDLGIEGVWGRARYVRGKEIPVDPTRVRDGPGTIRFLSSGAFPFTDKHDRTIYELVLPVPLASVEGNYEDAAIGVLFANDAPNGGWDMLGMYALDVPQGFIIFLTPP